MNQPINAKKFAPGRMVPLVLALLALGHSLFTGLEIDEQYALSLSYRLLRGDTLFHTMWEPHQLSSLPLVPVLALFLAVTGGTTGILLFVRAVTLLCKAGLSLAFYRLLKPCLGESASFWGALVLLVYTPKWFLGPDYISQQFHFTAAAFLLLWAYYAPGPRQFRRPWLAALAAVCACFSYLAFPQSIVAAAPLFAGLWLLGKRAGEPAVLRAPRGAVVFLGSCILCGLAFVCYVLREMTVPELIARAGMILNDPQYNFTAAERLARLAAQAADVAKTLAKPALLAAAGCLAASAHEKRNRAGLFLPLFAGSAVLFCCWYALRERSMDMRQFLPVLVLLGGWVFWRDRRQAAHREVRALLFWLGWLPGLTAYLMILRSTLLGLAPTFMYLTWPALCGLLALAPGQPGPAAGAGRLPERLTGARLAQGLLALVFGFVVLCRCCLVMTTGWKPAALWDTGLKRIGNGPAAGIAADVREADRQAAFAEALAPYEGAQVLQAIGEAEGLVWLMDSGTLTVAQASVISGTDSDPRFIAYYEEFPEKIPDVVLYDRNENRDLADFHRWIEENLPVCDRYEVTVGTAALEVLVINRQPGKSGA